VFSCPLDLCYKPLWIRVPPTKKHCFRTSKCTPLIFTATKLPSSVLTYAALARITCNSHQSFLKHLLEFYRRLRGNSILSASTARLLQLSIGHRSALHIHIEQLSSSTPYPICLPRRQERLNSMTFFSNSQTISQQSWCN
jgi:hypothetical protein